MAIAFAVAFGGSLGALSRYGVDTWIEQRSESLFPWATFVINMTGCFAVGFLIAAVVDRHNAPQWLRTGLVVGFCGGYTTFSSFSLQTLTLAHDGEWLQVGGNILLSVALCLVSVWLGHVAASGFNQLQGG